MRHNRSADDVFRRAVFFRQGARPVREKENTGNLPVMVVTADGKVMV